MAAESHPSSAPTQDGGHPISQKKQGRMGKYTAKMADAEAVQLALVRPQGSRGAPWSPVTMIYQLVAHNATPIRKLEFLKRSGLPSKK